MFSSPLKFSALLTVMGPAQSASAAPGIQQGKLRHRHHRFIVAHIIVFLLTVPLSQGVNTQYRWGRFRRLDYMDGYFITVPSGPLEDTRVDTSSCCARVLNVFM
jgi:hypothetical protein